MGTATRCNVRVYAIEYVWQGHHYIIGWTDDTLLQVILWVSLFAAKYDMGLYAHAEICRRIAKEMER